MAYIKEYSTGRIQLVIDGNCIKEYYSGRIFYMVDGCVTGQALIAYLMTY